MVSNNLLKVRSTCDPKTEKSNKLVKGSSTPSPVTIRRLNSANNYYYYYQARARRACALRALGLLLADGAPTVGRGKTF